MVRPSIVLVLAMLVLPAVALAPTADACSAAGVPCGRIYPQITMRVADQLPVYNVTQGVPLELDAELTFKFDMLNEGYTVPSPNEPVVVSFEFPRKPDWAELSVEPERIPIPVHDPTYFEADPTASTPTAYYVYKTNIKITATVVGQAVLRDGYDYAKLLVFAKSSESGLYQAGYGIKEIRVAPEGALHESDLAGTRDVFTAQPLPELALEPAEGKAAGVTVTLTPPSQGKFWEPLAFDVGVSPAFQGSMVVALHDEEGNLVTQTLPLDASAGSARFNATLVKPGLHTATVTLLPLDASVPAVTVPVDFVAGTLEAEGWAFPKTYAVTLMEATPPPTGNADDALAQFERDIPFFAFDTAQSVTASVALVTPGVDALGRGVTNIQFSIHDPEGNLLQQASVDPTVPAKSVRVGSLPQEGWFALRLKGAGLPAGSAYSVRVEAVYAAAFEQRNVADGAADATAGVLGLGGRNVTLPTQDAAVWTPTPFTPAVEGFDSMRYTMTVFDANGSLAYATGVRAGAATFSPPSAGIFRAFVFAEPVAPTTAFSPIVRAFTFGVGNATSTTMTTFALDDVLDLSQAHVTDTLVGMYALPAVAAEGALDVTATGAVVRFVDAEGHPIDAPSKLGVEPVFVQAFATRTDGAAEGGASIAGTVSYGVPVSLVGPDVAPSSADELSAPIPFLAAGVVLALVGIVAIAVAFVRR